jgi:hypothetical protein
MKKAAPKYQQSSPSQGKFITALSLLATPELASLLSLPTLVCVYWLWEAFA